jgi:hypothetical protein
MSILNYNLPGESGSLEGARQSFGIGSAPEWLRQNLLVFDEPGSGKTVALRHLGHELAERCY